MMTDNGRGRTLLASVLVLLLAAASLASAQTGSAVLTGTVVDNVGVVPGATVTAIQVDTNVARSVTTNEQGVFRLSTMMPGRYTIKVEMDGFKPVNMPAFPLLANETRDLGRLTMSAGGVSESVTITAEVTPVQTATSALTKNITSDTLVSVQVKGRDIFGMMKILPGVVDTTSSRDFAQWNSGRGLSINGGNSLNKNTTIDGVPVGEEGGDGTTHITPNIDAIGEVNVITSGYTAENGRQSSGLISIVTKSGTNQYRGSAWYSARRDEWNKNDYFRIQQKVAKPFFALDIGGYSVGGPIIIPGVMDSRTTAKKVYFFLSQEFTDDMRPANVNRTNLPTALERTGDFSQTFTGRGTGSVDGVFLSGQQNLNTLTDHLTGLPFEGNRIPDHRIHPMGRQIVNLLGPPNGVRDPSTDNFWNSNDARDATPIHDRQNLVSRVDVVWNPNMRFSGKALFDRDNSITFDTVQPGEGNTNNVFPGDLLTGSMSQVFSQALVNEITVGFSHNHFGHRIGKGEVVQEDYTRYFRENYAFSPPRLEDFNPNPGPIGFSRFNKQEWPFMPDFMFSGGNRSNLAPWRPFGGRSRIAMTWNENYRYTFQDDLSWTKGRHNFKFGFFTERDSKTEPGSDNYTGDYNFGHNADNPLSTGNGYANALLGIFTTYDELNDRLDRENRHWQSDAYAQDSWRINSRMTLDYGLRVTHAGAVYENRGENSGFDPALWSDANAPLLYRPACKTLVAGDVACSTANRAAVDPRNPTVFLSQAYAGKTIPGTGSITNGTWVNGLSSHPLNPVAGKKDGWYYDMPAVSLGPRVGFAWDMFGDGKTALRASGGIFYNFINRGQYQFNGGAQISRNRQVLNSTIDELATLAASGATFAENPQGSALPDGFPLKLNGQQIPVGKLQPEKNYQANVAFQRDIGFNTVAEVAWVTNIGRHFWRSKTTNNIPIDAYGNVANLFNREPIAANFLRRDYRGTGSINYLTTDTDVLNYNAMQVSVQRRLSKGLQMGLAYTLSKSEGEQGWDFRTEELGGKQGIRERYYGPPSASQNQDRRHIAVVNYSYAVPNPTPRVPVLKNLLNNWEASGVIQFTSGNAIDPSCGTNIGGVANSDPSLTGIGVRCELVPGEDPLTFTPDTSLPFDSQAHFNVNAFRRPLPNGTVGNVGDVPVGFLRHPSWQNWDFTFARRIPVNIGRGGSVRLQFQLYNMWNMVEFTTMNASYTFTQSNATGNTNTNTGKYTVSTNPLNAGVTVRFDY